MPRGIAATPEEKNAAFMLLTQLQKEGRLDTLSSRDVEKIARQEGIEVSGWTIYSIRRDRNFHMGPRSKHSAVHRPAPQTDLQAAPGLLGDELRKHGVSQAHIQWDGRNLTANVVRKIEQQYSV